MLLEEAIVVFLHGTHQLPDEALFVLELADDEHVLTLNRFYCFDRVGVINIHCVIMEDVVAPFPANKLDEHQHSEV